MLPKPKDVIVSFWRMFHALAFYPLMIAAFIYLYIKGAPWPFGLAIIIAILVFDPMWRMLFRQIFRRR